MRSLLTLAMLALNLGIVSAQSGSLSGRVLSRTAQNVGQARVSLSTGARSTQTDSLGYFVLDSVPVGFYRVLVQAEGYESLISAELQIQSQQRSSVELILTEATVELGEVSVRSRSRLKMVGQPLSLLSIGLNDLEKGAGVNRDVSKAMQMLPGVGATEVNRNDLLVRGGGPAENKFYLDGVEIPIINHFSTQGASGGVVGMVNPDFVEEVNFYTSSLPIYAKALSSVMQIRQRDANRDRLHTKLSLGASDASLTLETPLGSRASLIASARQSYLQYLFKALKLPFLPTYNDFQLKYKHALGRRSQLSIVGIGAIDRMRLNTDLQVSGNESQRYILGYLPEYRQSNYTLGLVYKYYADEHTDTWTLSRNWLSNESEKYQDNDRSQRQLLDYSSQESENKLRFERLYLGLPFRLLLGAGVEYAKYRNHTLRQTIAQPEAYDSHLGLWSYQAFVQASKSYWGDRLGVSVGLAIQGNDLNGEMANPLKQLSPRLSLSYKSPHNWEARLSLARYSMLPSYTSLGYRDEQGHYVNRSRAKYIYSNQITFGAEYSPKLSHRVGAELFYKGYERYPVSEAEGISLASKGTDYGQVGDEKVLPIGLGRAYGLEIYGYIQPYGSLRLGANYTYVRSEFTDISGLYRPSSWDTRHIVNALVSYQLPKGWFVSARWRLVGSLPYSPIDMGLSTDIAAWQVRGRAYIDYERFNTLRLGASHQLDLRIDKEFSIGRSLLNFYIDVQNVYAAKRQQAPIYTNLSEAGSVMLDPTNPSEKQMLRPLERSSGTLLPTIGIIFKH